MIVDIVHVFQSDTSPLCSIKSYTIRSDPPSKWEMKITQGYYYNAQLGEKCNLETIYELLTHFDSGGVEKEH